MGATSDNFLALSYTFETDIEGNTLTNYTYYNIASDYVNPFGGETAHFQIVKTVYGTGDEILNITPSTPLPVQPSLAWTRYDYLANSGYYSLATTIVGYTGDAVRVEGSCGGEPVYVSITNDLNLTAGDTLPIRNLSAIDVSSGDTGGDWVGVRGISGAYPVGVTFAGNLPVTITSLADSGVYGVEGATAIGVTFGEVSIRGLSADTDSVTVKGGGTGEAVYVGVYGYEGGETASIIHAENNALNVNVKDVPGITVSASDLDIRDLSYTSDSITVHGFGPEDEFSRATVPTYINAIDANESLYAIGGSTGSGWCGAALNVFLVNQGITFEVVANATFDANVSVQGSVDNPLPIYGSTYATSGLWVTGSTNGDPVVVQGSSGGYLPVEVKGVDERHQQTTNDLQQLKTNTEYLVALKKAIYSDTVGEGALAYPHDQSLYALMRNIVGNGIQEIQDTITESDSQKTIAVSVIESKRQSSFISRTGFVGAVSTNLSSYNSGNGFTCETGVKIKVSNVATGTNSSQNEHICIISEADAAIFGNTNTTASFMMYHGDEMHFDVDNINRIRVFYPPLSAESAPFNTGSGVTFSFYAS
jgi:hypothetical protein